MGIQFGNTNRGVVGISDNSRYYDYVIEQKDCKDSPRHHIFRVHIPEYCPEKFGKFPTYSLSIWYWEGSRVHPLLSRRFTNEIALAQAPWLYENNWYYEYVDIHAWCDIPDGKQLYLSLEPVEEVDNDWVADINFSGGQGAVLNRRSDIGVKFEYAPGTSTIKMQPTLGGKPFVLTNTWLRGHYGDDPEVKDNTKYYASSRIYIANDTDIFEYIDTEPVSLMETSGDEDPKEINNGREYSIDISQLFNKYSNAENFETSHYRYQPGLRLQGVLTIYKHVHEDRQNLEEGYDEDDMVMDGKTIHGKKYPDGYNFEHPGIKFLGLRTEPLPITPELYAQWCYDCNEKIDLTNMNLTIPRLINKTIQQNIVVTADTDSKANIVQPIFFRTRELANIVIHPEVTENIAINLDAYKSQVDKFMIRVEGITFIESGRIEGGVVFNIKGSLLPGKVASGKYYILNQDAEMVTTGNYQYER